MKALTIWQPWASLIMIGAKPFEFRGWDYSQRFPRLVGQRIVIHAAARPIKRDDIEEILWRIECNESALLHELALPLLHRIRKAYKCQGVVEMSSGLGTAILGQPQTVTEMFRDTVADSDLLDHSKFGWPLTDVKPFEVPVPMRGAQGFWNWKG